MYVPGVGLFFYLLHNVYYNQKVASFFLGHWTVLTRFKAKNNINYCTWFSSAFSYTFLGLCIKQVFVTVM